MEETVIEQRQRKVVVLGREFASDDERREWYRAELRAKLPELKKMEGFPVGTDEDIIALSDPPYYTACPNPWIADFVHEWESEKPQGTDNRRYSREPFAADVSEGKNDPIYNAHSYYTKVPHKAIMRYILHYTEPGDIVFDGFCGTGMTGVAAQLCGDRDQVLSLGYQVKPDGTILRQETDAEGKTTWVPFSRLGGRHAVLNDLSPAATFIAYNYNTPVDVDAFRREATRILDEVQKECGWMYETRHTDGRTGTINYTVWSDVFVCPTCGHEVVFYDAAVDQNAGKVLDTFACPNCGSNLTKSTMEHAWVSRYDKAIGDTIRQTKQVPVLINYTCGGKRYEKKPDAGDLALIDRIENADIPYWYPTNPLPAGDKMGEPLRIGITHVHQMVRPRVLHVIASYYDRLTDTSSMAQLREVLTGSIFGLSRMQRYAPKSTFPNMILTGTLYVGSLEREWMAPRWLLGKTRSLARGLSLQENSSRISTQSATSSTLPDSTVDYLFLDPPFGSNLMYSELNFLWESWLKVWTNNGPEAIENKTQHKGIDEYRQLMLSCFREAFRVLKPGRWMTVEFSNTQASVWNAIQTAIQQAGFVIANVAALDKQQHSFNAVTTTSAVKQDLVISAYKPTEELEAQFAHESGTEQGVWGFVRMQLEHLPVVSLRSGILRTIEERTPRALYNRMVACYVARGARVPLDSADFQQQARNLFVERDDMLFLDQQVAAYDRAKLRASRVETEELFVTNEATAIAWLRRELGHERSTYQNIVGPYMKVAQAISKHEKLPELRVLLEQNFLQDEQGRWYVPDPHKESDLQKLRDRDLLKDFDQYRQEVMHGQKRLKEFRIDAIRAGFRKCWEDRLYSTITMMAEHIPSDVLEQDEQLQMYYDNALLMLGK